MMFPGPGAQIYYNEAGEVLGWDYPDRYEPEPYDDDDRDYEDDDDYDDDDRDYEDDDDYDEDDEIEDDEQG